MSTTDRPHRSTQRRLVDTTRITIAVVLGTIGAAAGFKHTHDWAIHNGQTGWLAWADAVVIEGIAIVAGFELHHEHHTTSHRRHIAFPATVLTLGITIQMAAQVSLAPATPAGWLVAAMPALGFLTVIKLLMRRTPTPTSSPAAPVPDAAPPPPTDTTPAPDPTAEIPDSPATSGGSMLTKIPTAIRDQITTNAARARVEGRALTATDITDHIALPESMVTALLSELAT